VGLGLTEGAPDHSTLSRTRRLIDLETHQQVFDWVLARLAEGGLLRGRTVGIDATTLEANAALRSLVHNHTRESYQQFLTRLAQESGIGTPTREDLARLDRQRARKGSNDDWHNPYDPDAKITKLKDGSTHLAHKHEQAVDMDTGAVVAVTVQAANAGDTTTWRETFEQAASSLAQAAQWSPAAAEQLHDELAEVVADKGYHSNQTLVDFAEIGVRSYVAEPRRGRRNWSQCPAARAATYANRRRVRGARGRRLMRRRGELVERPFAHLLETGGLRRVHLRRANNILKRLLVHVAAYNLSLLMRKRYGVGTPRSLQGRPAAAAAALLATLFGWLTARLAAWGRWAAYYTRIWPTSVSSGGRRFLNAA
jgi:transposase